MLFALFICVCFVSADYKQDIYEAFVTRNMGKWKATIDKMEAAAPQTQALQLELINYQYGYIGWCLGEEKNKEAKHYLEKAEAAVSRLIKKNDNDSQMHAYMAAFYGFKVNLSPIKAPVLGPKCLEHAELALSKDKKNPFAYLQYGNALYFRPKLFGGSKEKALAYYLKAEQLMSSLDVKNDWNYLNVLAQIVLAYQETDQHQKVDQYFRKALTIEPRFTWVKEGLLPKLKAMEQ